MSRRSQIVRNSTPTTSSSLPRDPGAFILCFIQSGTWVAPDTPSLVGPIEIDVTLDYRRVFVSATVSQVSVTVGS